MRTFVATAPLTAIRATVATSDGLIPSSSHFCAIDVDVHPRRAVLGARLDVNRSRHRAQELRNFLGSAADLVVGTRQRIVDRGSVAVVAGNVELTARHQISQLANQLDRLVGIFDAPVGHRRVELRVVAARDAAPAGGFATRRRADRFDPRQLEDRVFEFRDVSVGYGDRRSGRIGDVHVDLAVLLRRHEVEAHRAQRKHCEPEEDRQNKRGERGSATRSQRAQKLCRRQVATRQTRACPAS